LRIFAVPLAIIGLICLGIYSVFILMPLVSPSQIQEPPVNIVKSKLIPSSGYYYYEFTLHNTSEESHEVVVVIKTQIEDKPRMSDPVVLGPHERKIVRMDAPKDYKDFSSGSLRALHELLYQIEILRVEYTHEEAPNRSSIDILFHEPLHTLFLGLGVGFLGAAVYSWKVGAKNKAEQHKKLPT